MNLHSLSLLTCCVIFVLYRVSLELKNILSLAKSDVLILINNVLSMKYCSYRINGEHGVVDL